MYAVTTRLVPPDSRGITLVMLVFLFAVSLLANLATISRAAFSECARGRQLGGATIVLDSSGGSVNDSIALGRRWRNLGALTTVGISVETNTAPSTPASMAPVAHCESMCVFLLLSGKTRYVPETA